jgi:hypothetical protein
MDVWTITSRPALQRFFGVTLAVVGGLLMWLSHRPPNDSASAQWLGVLLTVAGLGGFIGAGRETITVDPHSETITVTIDSPLSSGTRVVSFAQIENIRMNRLGSSTNGTVFYSLTLELRDDKPLTLFAPGRFYAGCMNRATVDQWRSRLWSAIRGDGSPFPVA